MPFGYPVTLLAAAMTGEAAPHRHCGERSDEAIHSDRPYRGRNAWERERAAYLRMFRRARNGGRGFSQRYHPAERARLLVDTAGKASNMVDTLQGMPSAAATCE